GASSIDAGTGNVTLANAGNNFTGALAVSGAAVSLRDANALRMGAVSADSLVLSSGGAITQGAAATVGGTTTIDAGNHAVTLDQTGNDFGRVAVLRGGAVSIRDANALQLGATDAASLTLNTGGAITQSADLQVRGTASLNAGSGDITLTRAGNDFGSIALRGGAIAVSDANALTVSALEAAADHAVSLSAGTVLTLPSTGSVDIDTGTADLRLASRGGRLVTQGTLAGHTVELVGSAGIVLGGNVSSTTDQTYATAVTLARHTTLDAGSGRVTLAAGLAGGGNDLTVAGAATLGADVSGTRRQTWNGLVTLDRDLRLDSGAGRIVLARGVATGANGLTVASPATLGGDVIGTGSQAWNGALTLASDVVLDAGGSAVSLQGGVAGAGHALQVMSRAATADAIRTGAALRGLTRVTLDGRATLGGDVTSSGAQRYTGTLQLDGDVALDAGAGTIALDGAVGGRGHALSLASAGSAADSIRVAAPITGVSSLEVTGPVALGGNVTSTGTQTYRGPVRLDTDLVLTGPALDFAGAVDGAQALTLEAARTSFGADVGSGTALSRLVIEGGGTSHVGGAVRTSGAQTWDNAIVLDADATFAGSALHFGRSIEGAHALTVTGAATLAGGRVATGGAQRYDGALTLGSNLRLSGASLRVDGRLDGAHALTLDFSGTSTLAGVVGGTTPLASLSATGTVALEAGSITTTGAQDFGASLRLSGDTALHASRLRVAGAVSGAHDLLLDTDALVADSIQGDGVLSIRPRSAGTTIGIAGAGGSLQISQALITSAGGFTRHEFGRGDGTGQVRAGDWELGAATTLRSGTGGLQLGGRVDGAFDLALNSSGLTQLDGAIGTDTPLASLSTDSAGSTTIGAERIVTSGAQTYADPLQVAHDLQLSGTRISAEQRANRFGGRVSADATTLLLRSAEGITLGRLTLAQGGRVESDGVLHLAGDLQLSGGTLSLVSNAVPDKVDGFTDPDLNKGDPLTFGFSPLFEATGTIVQDQDTALSSAAGSLLVLRSSGGGSILLDQAGNRLLGGVSAVSGPLGDNSPGRFAAPEILVGFVRINSSEIHVAGAPPAAGAPDPGRAGLEADAIKLTTDRLSTGPDGQIRARLPFEPRQGSKTSLPALTLVLGRDALASGTGYGTPDGAIQVRIGAEQGGFVTVRPKGAGADSELVILIAGPEPRPFYDGAGKASEVRIFYNGDAPRTPQETGALTAVTATVEDARQTRFEEAVRTENVKSRLRSGVIAEVGSGRPATVGRESIKLPENCPVKPDSLQCN
ncbi:beta strand repeat-containing protein, partial [Piscinibacter defluvii]|uniref:beta strand repeat-containing protein n=1 Tax=Piscinibacter defluvii TaxID=1796922 RepID=UPI0013E40676